MINFSPGDLNATAGNALAESNIAGVPVTRQNPGADHDITAMEVGTDLGTYELHHIRYKRSIGGIVETWVNGSLVDTWDGYHAGDQRVDYIISGVTLNAGFNLVEFKINGKNAASAGFYFFQGACYFVRV